MFACSQWNAVHLIRRITWSSLYPLRPGYRLHDRIQGVFSGCPFPVWLVRVLSILMSWSSVWSAAGLAVPQ